MSLVGINEIIREADVARMSLYNHFASKDDLALAAYAAPSEARQDAFDAAISAAATPGEAVIALFDLARDLARAPEFRGCAFIGLAAHAEPGGSRLTVLVRQHKAALRARFTTLAEHAGAADPDLLGRQLLALWDGAISDAFIEADDGPITAARAAAQHLLTHTP